MRQINFTAGRNHSQTKDFDRITFEGLVHMAKNPFDLTRYPLDDEGKAREAKSNCPWFLPVIAHSKRKDELSMLGRFNALIADIDAYSHDLSGVIASVKRLGIETFLIYSTISAKPGDLRWRVVVPMAEEITAEHFRCLQICFSFCVGGDSCMKKINQISYLPALSKLNATVYDHEHQSGELLDPFSGALNDYATQLWKKEQAEAKQAEEERLKRQDERTTQDIANNGGIAGSGQISAIDAFNDSANWNDLLIQFGFKKRGAKWVHPSSKSGAPGVIISFRDSDAGRYVSSHENDPLCDGHSHDKFNLFRVMQCNGDHGEAIRAIGEMISVNGVTLTEHNRKAFLNNKSQEEAAANANQFSGLLSGIK